MKELDLRPCMEMDQVFLSFKSRKGAFEQGSHNVLRGVSLKLYIGETLGVIGRNGVGKTSMLRVLSGILAPTRGKVYISPGTTSSLLTIGLGFKGDLTGRDNAMLSAMLSGATRKQALGYLDEIKVFSELGDSFEEPEKTYSAGMRMRLAFTTALKTEVDVLLIDEVLSVGDAHFRAKALEAMKNRIKSEQTVVFVSHIAPQVRELCDRVVWIEDGEIRDEGDTDRVLDAYLKFINA